jgi:predicted transposase YbfD/YdcC
MVTELDLEGVTVTIDAMHTQTATAEAIVKKKGTTS